jgi:hypothetical protein
MLLAAVILRCPRHKSLAAVRQKLQVPLVIFSDEMSAIYQDLLAYVKGREGCCIRRCRLAVALRI